MMCGQYLFQFQIIFSVKMFVVKPITMEVIEVSFCSEIICRQFLFQFHIIIPVKKLEVKPIAMEVIEISFCSDSVCILYAPPLATKGALAWVPEFMIKMHINSLI